MHRRKLILIFLLLTAAGSCYAQVTIYYNDKCEITMRELATHYRVTKVDTALRKFIGEVKDFWPTDSAMSTLTYDMNGIRDGAITIKRPSGKLRLTGQYLDGERTGIWRIYNEITITHDFDGKDRTYTTIDSIETCLTEKENFTTSQYIRKSDYREIYPLINKSYSRNGKDILEINDQVFTVAEERAYFPGGLETLAKFIRIFITYPEEAAKK